MFQKIYRKFACQKLRSEADEQPDTDKIPSKIDEIKLKLTATFEQCEDIVMREIQIGKSHQDVIVVFAKGLVNKDLVDRDIIRPILSGGEEGRPGNKPIIKFILENVIAAGQVEQTDDYALAVESILSGLTAIFINGESGALLAETIGFAARSVEKPDSESVERGPREGFTEVLKTNISLLRRKIKNPNLKFETIKLGARSRTCVCICYINGLTNDAIIAEVKKRLCAIKIDAILESGYLEEYIEDAKFSLFPTVGNTEKPDVAAAKVLEGRVAILCDGTPFVLTVPYLFIEMIQASEDYYMRPFYATFLRILRMISLIISTIVPALYVALINFHQDMIPTELAVRIASSREGIPFSAFMEAIAMVITFELLREAGSRMPKTIGQAVNIVGALVIGQAAVEAGLVSDIMVIVIAITAISSFIVVPLSGAALYIRVLILISANVLGLLGVGLMLTALFANACSLRSFGMPYMSPLAPLIGSDLKDTIIRVPIWAMLKRPRSLRSSNLVRESKASVPQDGANP